MRRFEGRRAFVTGAGSGIGRATVGRLAEEGAAVLAVDLNADGLAESATAWPASVDVRALDICDDEATAALREWRADVLVNAAGILRRHAILEHTLEDWERTMAVNLTAPLRLSREFAARLVVAAEPGAIVNVCSIEAFSPIPAHIAYTASKGGVMMMTRAFAHELSGHGVRVNAIAPGVTATGMNRSLREDPERSARLLEKIPVGRFGEPADQAAAIAFLASAEAGYITGSILPVDGGWLTL